MRLEKNSALLVIDIQQEDFAEMNESNQMSPGGTASGMPGGYWMCSGHGEAGLIREFCAQTAITDLHEYTLYSSCEPCFMCSGAMVWVKLGRLVYGASNIDLERI